MQWTVVRRRLRQGLGVVAVLAVVDVTSAQFTDVLLDQLLVVDTNRSYRVQSSIHHHDLRPNVDVVGQWGKISYRMRTDSLGFRSAGAGTTPLSGRGHRLVIIGDSFTEGVGVPFEETFVGRIKEAYRTKSVDVLNAGVVSYSPIIYYRKIRHLIETVKLRIDTLAVFVDLSDIREEAQAYTLDDHGNVVDRQRPPEEFRAKRRRRLKAMERRIRNALVRNSLIFRFGRGLKKSLQKARCPRQQLRNPRGTRWDIDDAVYRDFGIEGLALAAEFMDRLYRLTRDNRTQMILAVYPWPEQIARKLVETRQVTFWRDWSRERDIPFLNLFPVFIADEAPATVIRANFIACDVHWNARGHGRAAEAFLKRFPGPEALARRD